MIFTNTKRCCKRLGTQRSETAVLEVERGGGQTVDHSLDTVDSQLFTDGRVCRFAEVHVTSGTVVVIFSVG